MNLADCLFKAPAEAPALWVPGQAAPWRYGQLRGAVERLAGALAPHCPPGSRVGLLLYNQPEWAVAYLALLGLGVTVVPLSTRLAAPELQSILSDAGVSWLISSATDFSEVLAPVLADSPPTLKAVLWSDDGPKNADDYSARVQQVLWNTLSGEGRPAGFPQDLPPETLATLVYTSGTTGRPKGVMLSHGNLLADIQANLAILHATPAERLLTLSPLFHVFGQTNVLMSALWCGGSVVLLKRFQPRAALEAVQTFGVTLMTAVPTMYRMMLAHLEGQAPGEPDDPPRWELSSLRVCHSGAAPMPAALFERVEAAFGAPVQEGYGQSEGSSILTSNPLDGPRKPGSVGLPLPGVTLAVVDLETDAELPPGQVGEVRVQGAMVMQGYLGQPEATARVLRHGWLYTGDLGYLDDDGYLFLVDRKDDLINVGGQKVYPREVEEVLHRHPGVSAAAVYGIASELYHQRVAAVIVPNPGAELSIAGLQRFCRQYLADFKIPETIRFQTSLPLGPTGKILRRLLD